jgi:molybdopterin-guanine dinucleotide biosynthesis protein A
MCADQGRAMPRAAEAGHDADACRPFGIIVLAGGRASRLGGQDKPGLVMGDRTLIGSVVRAGIAAGARQLIAVGPRRPGLDGVSFVSEEPPGAGPVPALRRGLAEAAEPWAAVLAADLPFLGEAHLGMLLRAAAGHHGAVLVDDAGRPQWLAGCWRTEALRRRAAAYDGSSLRGLLGPLAPVLVAVTPGTGEPPPWLDCDTPEDLRRARAWIPGSRQHGNDPEI